VRRVFRTLRIAVLLHDPRHRRRRRAAQRSAGDRVEAHPVRHGVSDRRRRFAHTRAGVARLSADDFAPITDWLQDEVHRYGRRAAPAGDQRGAAARALPPPSRTAARWRWGCGACGCAFWAWRHDAAPGPRPDVRLFVLYHDPARSGQLDHSVGLRKGRSAS
jgi:hypothetical protein